MTQRTKIGLVLGEFLGTAVLTAVVLGVSQKAGFSPWAIPFMAGLTLSLMVLVIGPVTGSHINPAVTIGLWTLRKINTNTALVYIASQILGALVAWRLFIYFIGEQIENSAKSSFDWKVLLGEVLGTFVFTFGLAAAVTRGYEGYRAAFTIGTSLTVGLFVAFAGSNGILNPAVAIGVRSLSWEYVVGPIIGSIIGMNLYLMFMAPFEARNRKTKA